LGRPLSSCPGLTIIARQGRREAWWIARRDLRSRGFEPATVRLHPDPPADMDGPTRDALYMERCTGLWADMLAWADGKLLRPYERWDGTIGSLARIYQSHPDSPFHGCVPGTQKNYVSYCKDIIRTVGKRTIGALTGPDFRRWHANWLVPPGHEGEPFTRSAQAKMSMVRTILRFGIELRLPGCAAALEILSTIEFAAPKARKQFLEFTHADAIVREGLKRGTKLFRSVALGQALQFELTLRQTDVIGTWEKPRGPYKMPVGAVKVGEEVWLPGLTWEIIQGGRAEGSTSKNAHRFDFDLSLYPLVQLAMAAVPAEERKGPLVITNSGEPIGPLIYSRNWRKLADAVGVPANVWNRDSRAGGVTEATDADAPLESVRHHAQHSDVRTTARYSRNAAKKTAEVARIRVASRGQNKP